MSDVGESLPFDPSSHFELQTTDGNDICVSCLNSCQNAVTFHLLVVDNSLAWQSSQYSLYC